MQKSWSPLLSLGPYVAIPMMTSSLGAALSATADYIVTGDKALLAQDGFRGVKVVTPKKFLSQL